MVFRGSLVDSEGHELVTLIEHLEQKALILTE